MRSAQSVHFKHYIPNDKEQITEVTGGMYAVVVYGSRVWFATKEEVRDRFKIV